MQERGKRKIYLRYRAACFAELQYRFRTPTEAGDGHKIPSQWAECPEEDLGLDF
jgi:hypothetical protein